MRTLALLTLVLVSSVLPACSSSHGVDDRRDAHVSTDARDMPTPDAHTAPRDAFAWPDAWTRDDAGCVMPLGPTGRITAETAECLGLAEVQCAGCHVRDDVWDLRPAGAPPPPGITPAPPGSCGLCAP